MDYCGCTNDIIVNITSYTIRHLTQDLVPSCCISIMAFEISHNIQVGFALGRECGWMKQVMAQFLADSMIVLHLWGAEFWIICLVVQNEIWKL
jgi:hypothetical protein